MSLFVSCTSGCVKEENDPDAPQCLMNTFYNSAADSVQTFPINIKEISPEWLSKALNADVSSFNTKVCDEGQGTRISCDCLST